jgi:rubrerythrin
LKKNQGRVDTELRKSFGKASSCLIREKTRLSSKGEGAFFIPRAKEKNPMDALEMAAKMETDAISFYTEAAKKTNYPAGKKMFLTITEDEKRHLEMIRQIIKGLNVTHKDVSPMKNMKTIFEAMKDEMLKKVAATDDELEAFKIAMQMEKEGKAFYEKSLAHAKTDKEKALLQRLIEEERQHYDLFANTYQFLSDTGNWFMWEERGIVEGG